MFIKALSNTTTASTKAEFKGLSILDWIIIAMYLLLVLGIGLFFFLKVYFAKKGDSTSNFFTGGGKNPIIIVGLSMYATILSSLGYVNSAGQVAIGAWVWSGANVALVGIAPLVAIFIIPFYRRIKETTAYAFLEKRFNYTIRAINSISFILFQVFRVAVVLFVPVTVLVVVMDLNPYIILAIIGIVVVLLTAFGGFKAVIWTDAIQGAVLLLGIVVIMAVAFFITPWWRDDFTYHQILSKKSFEIGLGTSGIALLFAYSIVNSLYAFMGSQDVTQRYKGTKSLAKVRQTLYITSILGVITILLFFGSGSLLWTYYANTVDNFASDGLSALKLPNGESVQVKYFLANFIATKLPIGLIGLLFAAIFAASQSTVSSGLSAVANSIIVDFVEKGKKKYSDKTLTIASKLIVVIFGIMSIAAGAILIATDQDALFDYFTGIIAILNAPTVAIFILGIFSVRANHKGVLIGMVTALIVGVPIWLFGQKFMPLEVKITLHGGWLTLITFSITLVVGYFSSMLFKDLNTVKTEKRGKVYISQAENAKLVNRTIFTTTKEWKELTRIDSNIDKIEKWVQKGQLDKSYLEKLRARYEELDKIVSSQSN